MDVLTIVYRAILETGAGFGFAAGDPGEFGGFVVATLDTSSLFRRVLRARWHELLVPLLKRLIERPGVLVGLVETALYPARARRSGSLPELLVIAVEPLLRRGVGQQLVRALEVRLAELGVRRYEACVETNAVGARVFYNRLGFDATRRFTSYGTEWLVFEKVLS